MARWMFLAFVVFLVCPAALKAADAPKVETKVEAAIYQMGQAKWDESAGSEYKRLVIEEANKFCKASPMECGLKFWNSSQHDGFVAEHFEMSDGYPSYKKPYLNVSYSLKFPERVTVDDNEPSKEHVKQSGTQAISENMQGAFADSTGYRVLKMGHETYNLPPNTTLNIVMCIVGVVILLACIVLLFTLRKSCSHAHKPEPVEKLKVEVDAPENENQNKNKASSKDNLQNTGV